MNKAFVAALSALILVSGTQGCASTIAPVPEAASSQIASPAGESLAVSKDTVTVEDLLRWPLEGPGGADKVIAGLQQAYKMTPVPDGYRADGSAVLADNYLLSFASVRKLTGAIHIGLQKEPCYPPEQAAALIGAVEDPAINDTHGVDRGKTFGVTQNGVMVYFYTTPITYRCVSSIHIRTFRKILPASESASASKDMLTIENLLRWPLEGPAGVVRTGVELRRKFPDFEQLRPADFHRGGPMRLEDSYVLSFAWIHGNSESLSIGLESDPCFSPARAAEISGAILSPVFRDIHGVDRGRHYDAKGNGVRIRFTTTPETYRCVDSVQVHPIEDRVMSGGQRNNASTK